MRWKKYETGEGRLFVVFFITVETSKMSSINPTNNSNRWNSPLKQMNIICLHQKYHIIANSFHWHMLTRKEKKNEKFCTRVTVRLRKIYFYGMQNSDSSKAWTHFRGEFGIFFPLVSFFPPLRSIFLIFIISSRAYIFV